MSNKGMTTKGAGFDLAILGAGAAGMMAGVAAGEVGKGRLRIGVFEKNVRAGIKVLVCGGGRCNFTNAGAVEFLIGQFGRNGRFLTPALRHLDNEGLREFFRVRGVSSHEEPGGKIYPDSNRAQSVVDAMLRGMSEFGVEVRVGAAGTVTGLQRGETTENTESGFLITTAGGETHRARAVVLAVGGMSYQRMGTTGDGYGFARGLGHTVVTPRPAIVGVLVEEEWVKSLQGLAVQDVEVRIVIEGGVLPKLATGKPTPSVHDVLFTHFGVSGPAILNPSEIVAELLEKFKTVALRIDFARHFSHDALHGMLRSWQQSQGKKLLRTLLAQHGREILIKSTSPDQTATEVEVEGDEKVLRVPGRLAEKMLELEGILPTQTCATLTASQIHRLVERLKQTKVTVTGTRGFKEAMVTAGGIALSEVDPKTLESKLVPKLFLTGEVLDLTGPSGGYNLQLAFSTGYLAGGVAARRLLGN